MSQRIGIIGGGLLGLGIAQGLQKQGHRVTVLEAADHMGGMAAPWQLGDIAWDRFYHVILLSDTFTQELLKELNLTDEFVGVETKTGFYTDGRFHSMSNSVEFLRFPPLGLLSKFRLGLTILRASRIKDWRAMEQLGCIEWLQKWSGKRTVEKIWRPLLKSKLGDSHTEASAAFIWATIQRMYAARRSGLKKELFGYVRGGYGRIVSSFVEHLQTQDVELRTGAAVEKVTASAIGPVVRLRSGESLQFDKVICTAAPPLAAKLLDLDSSERERLTNIRYQGIVCASVLLERPLGPYYVTNLTDDWVPFTGVIEMSALVDRAEFGGKSLVYLPKYVTPDDAIFSESDDSIRQRFISALTRMYPDFASNTIHAFQVARLKHVFPIPVKNYSELVPSIQTSLPGVYLVNSANIVNGTLNVNETLQLAENTHRQIGLSTSNVTVEAAKGR
jgi:protoporphyrinogen oxidase